MPNNTFEMDSTLTIKLELYQIHTIEVLNWTIYKLKNKKEKDKHREIDTWFKNPGKPGNEAELKSVYTGTKR